MLSCNVKSATSPLRMLSYVWIVDCASSALKQSCMAVMVAERNEESASDSSLAVHMLGGDQLGRENKLWDELDGGEVTAEEDDLVCDVDEAPLPAWVAEAFINNLPSSMAANICV